MIGIGRAGDVAVAVVLVCSSSGCAADEPERAFTIRDSLGVTIVETERPLWGDTTPWVLDTVPRLDLGASGDGPDHEFFEVRDAARLADGSVVVAASGSADVRRFDARGRLLWTSGRKGDGPGEFRTPFSVDRYGTDSLVVWDLSLRRITVLQASGELGRVASPHLSSGSPHDLMVGDPGRFVLRSDDMTFFGQAGRGRTRVPQPMLLLDAQANVLDTVTVARGFETQIVEIGDARPAFAKQSVAALVAGRLYVGDEDVLGFRVIDIGTAAVRESRVFGMPIDLTPRQRDSAAAALRAVDGPDRYRAVFDELAADIPSVRPAYSAMVVDASGHVWLGDGPVRADPTDEPRTWFVFDPDGVWLGHVDLPGALDPYEIGSDYVLGRWRDALGVETVRIYALTR